MDILPTAEAELRTFGLFARSGHDLATGDTFVINATQPDSRVIRLAQVQLCKRWRMSSAASSKRAGSLK